MTIEMTYTQARANLAELPDNATQHRATIIIHRRRGERGAVCNAERLLKALDRRLHKEALP